MCKETLREYDQWLVVNFDWTPLAMSALSLRLPRRVSNTYAMYNLCPINGYTTYKSLLFRLNAVVTGKPFRREVITLAKRRKLFSRHMVEVIKSLWHTLSGLQLILVSIGVVGAGH